jgi:hypothetical protein
VRPEVYATKLGQIWANFHSLEMTLRTFLALRDPRDALKEGQSFATLAVGDVVAENPTTDYASLGQLIDQFNKAASPQRRIDPTLVDLRDALAHGRVWSPDGSFPLRLLKFSRPHRDGSIRVTWATTMTGDWLDEQRQRVFEALVRAHGG